MDADFMRECDNAPRLNQLERFFSTTAAGVNGKPMSVPKVDKRLLSDRDGASRFIDLFVRRMGKFDEHYYTSIPYRLEEECRLGHALLAFAAETSTAERPFFIWSLGTAEGTLARTVAELGNGIIKTLACSATSENKESFFKYGEPEHSTFYMGSFHTLVKERMMRDNRLSTFTGGFDAILEDTTFQMYSPNRIEQVSFVKTHLKEGGILLLVEKCRHDDEAEYIARERQKDFGFKSRFYSRTEINKKKKSMLRMMKLNERTLSDMAKAIGASFKYCHVTWNSGNFYIFAASDNDSKLNAFVRRLGTAVIPAEYVYMGLPRCLVSVEDNQSAPFLDDGVSSCR